MDIFDRAQQLDAMYRRHAIQAALPPAAHGPSAEICACCSKAIPAARRQAQPGCTLCAQCQGEKERHKERR